MNGYSKSSTTYIVQAKEYDEEQSMSRIYPVIEMELILST